MKKFTIEDSGYALSFTATTQDNETKVSVFIPRKNKHERIQYWTTAQLIKLIRTKVPDLGDLKIPLGDHHHAYADHESGATLYFIKPSVVKHIDSKKRSRKN